MKFNYLNVICMAYPWCEKNVKKKKFLIKTQIFFILAINFVTHILIRVSQGEFRKEFVVCYAIYFFISLFLSIILTLMFYRFLILFGLDFIIYGKSEEEYEEECEEDIKKCEARIINNVIDSKQKTKWLFFEKIKTIVEWCKNNISSIKNKLINLNNSFILTLKNLKNSFMVKVIKYIVLGGTIILTFKVVALLLKYLPNQLENLLK